jgi:hypothetical protein
MMATQQSTFDPSRYLSKVGGADYLEVKWRLVWLRDVHPDASIETELISHHDQVAVFRARVSIPGGGSATGWGSEVYTDFRDYLEKAETKALGRALAALGFGTQFCPDFEFGAARGRVVDSPVNLDEAMNQLVNSSADRSDNGRRVASINQPATQRQLKFIQAMARDKGIDQDTLEAEADRLYGQPSLQELSRRDASAFIDHLQHWTDDKLAS